MNEEILKSIDSKLEAILKLIAKNMIDSNNKAEAIRFLGGIGLDNKIISDIVGTPPNVVRARLSEAKKKTNK